MRTFSAVLALAYFAGHAIMAFLLVFWATFPFENQSPEEAAGDDWLIGVGLGVFILGLVVALAIMFRSRWAVVAYAVALAAGGVLLFWALTVSEHSDGKLVLLGTAVEAIGLVALSLSQANPSPPDS
jgi:hypothetical protein